jgi:hypothetical protein
LDGPVARRDEGGVGGHLELAAADLGEEGRERGDVVAVGAEVAGVDDLGRGEVNESGFGDLVETRVLEGGRVDAGDAFVINDGLADDRLAGFLVALVGRLGVASVRSGPLGGLEAEGVGVRGCSADCTENSSVSPRNDPVNFAPLMSTVIVPRGNSSPPKTRNVVNWAVTL